MNEETKSFDVYVFGNDFQWNCMWSDDQPKRSHFFSLADIDANRSNLKAITKTIKCYYIRLVCRMSKPPYRVFVAAATISHSLSLTICTCSVCLLMGFYALANAYMPRMLCVFVKVCHVVIFVKSWKVEVEKSSYRSSACEHSAKKRNAIVQTMWCSNVGVMVMETEANPLHKWEIASYCARHKAFKTLQMDGRFISLNLRTKWTV